MDALNVVSNVVNPLALPAVAAPQPAAVWPADEADVVFVGAGPIGLWTAILTKIKDPQLKIVMLEKHAQYQRTQRIGIERESFVNIPNDPELRDIVADFQARSPVPIQDIEESLIACAQRKGVVILRGQDIDNPADLPHQFPHANFFIGSDGSRSIVRQRIFDDGYLFNSTLSVQAHITYRVNGQAQKIWNEKNPIGGGDGSLLASRAMEDATPLEERANGDEVRLIFQISNATFNAISQAKQGHPFHRIDAAEWNRIPQTLRDDIDLWLGVKSQYHGEVSDLGSMSLTAVKLKVYASDRFVTNFRAPNDNRDRTFCLVGDAAAGFPYFQGFNSGILSGTALSTALAQPDDRMRRIAFDNFSSTVKKEACERVKKSREIECAIKKLKLAIWWIPPVNIFNIIQRRFKPDFSQQEKDDLRNLVRQIA